MLFSKQNDNEPKHPGVKSVLGILLKLDIRGTIAPLRETTSVFINLLAFVFASQGMFPRNHPALTGTVGAPRLTFSEVMGTAWNGLTFGKDKIPQILLFFAVIASLIFSALAVASFALSLFIGKAHAQGFSSSCSGGYFAPCDSTNDIALSWINYIFKGQLMYNYLSQYGQVIPQSQVIQQALISALAFYSNAILIVAAVILFYHLASMVVETAHHGQVMGKRANQIWAPIRLVVAIGLLVPIAGGLNSGQFIVIKVAEWGSNLASQVWNVFVTNLANDQYNSVAASAPYARQTAYDVVMMEACMAAYNGITNGINGAVGSTSVGGAPLNTSLPGIAGTISYQGPINLGNGALQFKYDLDPSSPAKMASDFGGCGSVTFPPPVTTNDTISSTFQSGMRNTSMQAFNTLQTSARNFVTQYLPSFLESSLGGTGDSALQPNNSDFEQVVLDYQNALQSGMAGTNSGNFGTAMQQVAITSASQGWVSAGAWFNTIARAQSEMMDTSALIPATQEPDLKKNASTLMQKNMQVMDHFQDWLDDENPTNGAGAAASSSLPSQQAQLTTAAAGFAQQDEHSHLMDRIFYFVDWVASWNHVWQSASAGYQNATSSASATQNFSLGVQFTGANPLAEIAYLGHANINTAYDLFDLYLDYTGLTAEVSTALAAGQAVANSARSIPIAGRVAGGIGGLAGLLGKATTATAGAIGGIISLFAVLFFTSGVMLAFYLPLIPFFRFMFNVLTWIVSLIEAIVAVPLIALAHLNPEGDGLPGATGKAAYHFVFNIFLRPVLMVFGLIVGLLIFFIAVSYMNLLYTQAVVGAGGLAHGHLMLSRLIYSLLYVFTLYMAANSSFHMIDWLPEHAMKWMGAQGLTFHKMGDPDQLQQPMTLVTGYADSQIMQGVGKTGIGAFAVRGALGGNAKDADPSPSAALNRMGDNLGRHSSTAGDVLHGAANKVDGLIGGGRDTNEPPKTPPPNDTGRDTNSPPTTSPPAITPPRRGG